MGEQRRDLLPPALGHDSLQLARLGHGLTGHGQLHGEEPRVERRFCPGRSGLGRTRLEVMRVRQEGRQGRGQERGVQERLQGTRRLGVDGVEAVHRLVQPDAEFDLPAHPVEVGDLQWAKPWGQVCEAQAVALRGLDADEPEMPRVLRPPQMDVGIHGPAVADEGLRLEEGLEVRAGTELLADLPAGAIIPLGRPVLCQAEDAPDLVGVTGPQTCDTGRGQVGQPAVSPPGRVDRQRPAVMLPGGAAMVPYRGPAAARADLMAVERRLGAGPRKLLAQRVADRHRR
jgi:hypothetical protein